MRVSKNHHRSPQLFLMLVVVLVSNSYSLSEDLPSLMFGLRGRINLTVKVTSKNPDLHSGMMGGISVSVFPGLGI